MDYNMEEQQKCLEIADKINDIVKDESQGNKKNQQAGASNSIKQETPTTKKEFLKYGKTHGKTNFLRKSVWRTP